MPDTMTGLINRCAALAMRYGLIALTVFVLSLSLMVLTANEAFALRVTMKRIVFEGPKRTEILTIVNNTAEEQAYRLGWRHMRMTETKSLTNVKEGDPATDLHPVDEMVRFAPRRVVLAPGASQQVRLMLRRPKDLAEGEYRSHFWIQPEVEAVKFNPEGKNKDAKGPAVQIKMLTGMTLPVFVRNGNLTATAKISDVKIGQGDKGPMVSFFLHREGNRSIYGDMHIFCNGRTSGDPDTATRGIAVYTEVVKRRVAMDLPQLEGGAACAAPVTIKYVAPDEDPQYDKGTVMAEGTTG